MRLSQLNIPPSRRSVTQSEKYKSVEVPAHMQVIVDTLEVPSQGWQDVYLRDKYGWANLDAYLKHIKKDLDYIFEHDLVRAYCQHDWSSIRNDPDMSLTRQVIEYVLEKGKNIIQKQNGF